MSTKHTATLPDGTIAKRTSASRVYPFVIAVGPLSVEHIVDDIRAAVGRAKERLAYLRTVVDYLANDGEIVEGTAPYPFETVRPVWATGLPNNGRDERFDVWRGLGLMSGNWSGRTLEDFRAKMIERMTDSISREEEFVAAEGKRIAGIKVGPWKAAAWASRPDLATKTAESTRRLDPRRTVLVLDTERVEA